MSRTRNEYNGHVIHVISFPLADANFTVHFDIEAHRGGHIDVTHFESGQSFASDAKAMEAGLQMGQQKIDSDYGLKTRGTRTVQPKPVPWRSPPFLTGHCSATAAL